MDSLNQSIDTLLTIPRMNFGAVVDSNGFPLFKTVDDSQRQEAHIQGE